MNGRLLLVEDEDTLALGLVDVLQAKGYEVRRERDGLPGLDQAREGDYDLLILDAELPDLSGFEVLKELRRSGSSLRVLMLTARKSELDRVRGFELGVDDYVTKPFSVLELLGRIQAMLRRSPTVVAPQSGVQIGRLWVDLERFTAQRQGAPVALPTRAFEVLKALHIRCGEVVSRDELLDSVWGQEGGAPRTLNNLVVKIRHAIEPDPQNPIHLVTVHGVGYRLELS